MYDYAKIPILSDYSKQFLFFLHYFFECNNTMT